MYAIKEIYHWKFLFQPFLLTYTVSTCLLTILLVSKIKVKSQRELSLEKKGNFLGRMGCTMDKLLIFVILEKKLSMR